MVIGGGEIYRLFMPLAARIYLTRVDVDVDGDTFFPALATRVWRESAREEFSASDRNDHDFTLITYERVSQD